MRDNDHMFQANLEDAKLKHERDKVLYETVIQYGEAAIKAAILNKWRCNCRVIVFSERRDKR